MAKHKVDMGDYDETKSGAGYAGQDPPRGIYKGVMVAVDDHESKGGNEGFEWKFEIQDGSPYSGWRGYVYSDLGNTKWKTQQIGHAITGKTGDFTIDTDDQGAKMVKKAKPVLIRVISEKYEGENRAKIRSILPIVDEDSTEEETDPFA